jgi:type II secretory pathway component GspD/PulD (secretin)
MGMGGMGGMGMGLMGGMGGMGMGGMGGMGMGGMGGYGMGSMGGMGMGSMGGMGMGSMGGYGMGGMGGMGMGMMGGGSMAMSLRNLIEQSIDPETWYDNYPDTAEAQVMLYPDSMPKKMAVSQTPEGHNKIAKLLAELRKALGTQVSVEARFLAVGENFLEDIGLDLDFRYNFGGKFGTVNFTSDSVTSAGPDGSKVSGSLGGISPAIQAAGTYGTVLDDLQVSYLLHMTQARTDGVTLTAPKATVISGEPTQFYVLDTIWYATPGSLVTTLIAGLTSASTTQPTIQEPQQMQLGPNLYITPTVMADKKHVLLNIQAGLTELLQMQTIVQPVLTGTTNTTGTGTGTGLQNAVYQMPQTEQTSIATRVSVPDGGTLLLGGQKIAAEVTKEVGVPILSKIPILGRLFTNRSTVRDQRVLLVLVKPTIILQEEHDAEAAGMVEGTETAAVNKK